MKETVWRLAHWFVVTMRILDVKTEFYPAGMCGSHFAALLRKQYDRLLSHYPRSQYQDGYEAAAGGHLRRNEAVGTVSGVPPIASELCALHPRVVTHRC
jgi:hypothetical protein